MSEVKLVGASAINIPNMPWQEKPAGYENPIWRHNDNPVIKRNPAKGVARIFTVRLLRMKAVLLVYFV